MGYYIIQAQSLPGRRNRFSGKISLWQKLPSGYLRILSNERGHNVTQSTPVLMPNLSGIVQKTEQKGKYIQKIITNKVVKHSVFKPIFSSGIIKAVIQVTIEDDTPYILNSIFENSYSESEIPFFIDKKGTQIVNTEFKYDFKESEILRQMKVSRQAINNLNFSINEKGEAINGELWFSYVEQFGAYVGVFIDYNVEKKILNRIKLKVTISYVITFLILGLTLASFSQTDCNCEQALIQLIERARETNYSFYLYNLDLHLN